MDKDVKKEKEKKREKVTNLMVSTENLEKNNALFCLSPPPFFLNMKRDSLQ